MKWGQRRRSESIGHRLKAGEMKIIRTFIIFNSTVRSDEAQHRCYGGLPITVQPYFSLLSPSSPTTPQVIIEEQRAAICPCLLSAPCGCACLCMRVCVCTCACTCACCRAMRGSRNNGSAAVAHPPSQCKQRGGEEKKENGSVR